MQNTEQESNMWAHIGKLYEWTNTTWILMYNLNMLY